MSNQPGKEESMSVKPDFNPAGYVSSGKLTGKVAVITGGDSGIGRAVSLLFAKEGADIAIIYLDEHEDAKITKDLIDQEGRRCILIAGDIGVEEFCNKAIDMAKDELGDINILINNAAQQFPQDSIKKITSEQLFKTFNTNIFSMFYLTKAALKYLKDGDTIINTTSVTAYRGNPELIDYSSTKGAIVSFTRSLSQSLIDKGIRVNGVAPGPIWTPLIPSTFKNETIDTFGKDTPMKRAGQPEEVAPCFLFLASNDSSYIAGQILHPNGGTIING
jgi:NAD(P)-dependent dehydrogenase (short-subunit alcohol dehydrogenase family)